MTAIESLPIAVILWLTLAVVISGFIQGALGFGFPFIATPMVAMVVDMRTAIITVLLPTLAPVVIMLVTSGPLGSVVKRFWMMPVYATLGALTGLVALGLDVLVSPSAKIDMAGFSFGGIIGGLVAARLGRRVRTIVLLGPNGLALTRAPIPPLRRAESSMTANEIRRVHRENLRLLMIAKPEAVDNLAVYLQMENVRRARFKPGSIPSSDALLQALPAIRARITGIWGGNDAFAASHIEDRRQVLASVQRDLDFRVINGAGHWVTYEATNEVNAALLDMLL